MDYYIERENKYKNFGEGNGLRRSKSGKSGLGFLLKKSEKPEGAYVNPHHFPCKDHTRYWNKSGRPHLITSEPYSFTGGDFALLYNKCEELGLELYISGGSIWYPGRTVFICITKKDED